MEDVKELLNAAEEDMEMAAMHLEECLSRIRAGKANVHILDGIRVDSYGSMVPLSGVATVMVPDPRSITIKPWDKSIVKNGVPEDVEKDAEESVQKIHDKYIKKLEAMLEAKNKEIMTV